MLNGVINDLSSIYVEVITNEDYSKVIENHKGKFLQKMRGLEKYIGKNEFVNGGLTYSDFLLNQMYTNFKSTYNKLKSGVDFSEFQNIERVVANYRNLKELQKIVEEQDKVIYYPPPMIKAPINN